MNEAEKYLNERKDPTENSINCHIANKNAFDMYFAITKDCTSASHEKAKKTGYTLLMSYAHLCLTDTIVS